MTRLQLLLLLVLNILVFFILAKLIFKRFKEFKKAVYYLIKPDIISILQKDYPIDFRHTHKMILLLIIMGVTVVTQIFIFA